MMHYLLLFTSVFLDTFKNIYYNYFGKNMIKTQRDTMLFNMVCCVGSVIYFLCRGARFQVSGFSFVMAAIFSVVTVGAQYFQLLSMRLGPMSYSVLFTYLSMLIPTLFGIFYYGNTPSILQIIGLVLMVVTFFLSCEFKGNTKVSLKWFVVAMCSFLSWGLIGICQQIHQTSEYAGELSGFLMWTFVFSGVLFAALFFMSPDAEGKTQKLRLMPALLMTLTGVAIGAINEINLFLSVAMDPVVFFPVVNGGVIILSGLAAIMVFKEKLSVKQSIGLLTGIASVIFLGF